MGIMVVDCGFLRGLGVRDSSAKEQTPLFALEKRVLNDSEEKFQLLLQTRLQRN